MRASSLHNTLVHLIQQKRPPFIWGPPGIGKSDIVHQVGEELNMEVRDVRLSLMDPIDLKGFPVPDLDAGVMRWLPAEFLPRPDPVVAATTKKLAKGVKTAVVDAVEQAAGRPVLLFLDEMNSAPQSVQAAAYQLILNRRIGEYILPANCAIVAAGNRSSDRSVVHAQPAALANRFVHLDLEVDANDWDLWAEKNGMHDHLRAFIKFRPGMLHDFDPSANPRAFQTPRSWAFVNDIYKSNLSPNEELETIKGTVGEAGSSEFVAFTRRIKDLPTVDDVIKNPTTAKLPDEPGGKWAIALALVSATTNANFATLMKYMTRLDTEFQVVYVRGALRVDGVDSNKTYMDWGIKNQKVLM